MRWWDVILSLGFVELSLFSQIPLYALVVDDFGITIDFKEYHGPKAGYNVLITGGVAKLEKDAATNQTVSTINMKAYHIENSTVAAVPYSDQNSTVNVATGYYEFVLNFQDPYQNDGKYAASGLYKIVVTYGSNQHAEKIYPFDPIITHTRPPTSQMISDEERSGIHEGQNQNNTIMYMIGIGAAIAGGIAFIALRKTRKANAQRS